jgi:asparagine synthase (glutamine-hydrolysing)
VCGLVGAYQYSGNFSITPEYLIKMRDSMTHRGPDGSGLWISDKRNIGLAHRRLSILDLSPNASQPMCNADRTIQLVFNGEIYNHKELRNELTNEYNIKWKTSHSDTEVIIKSYEVWGIDCLKRFRGMFAIALWDAQERKLWLVRDRIGIKPLYWSQHHGRITFASEIKALLCDPDQQRKCNSTAMADYFAFICTPAPNTMFEGIKKLEPGTWLCINDTGKIKEHRWYDVLDHADPSKAAKGDELYEQVFDSLNDSINIHKESDVPVGVFLSGGVDSSANAKLFSSGSNDPLKTFTIGYDAEYETYTNELPFARQMADEVGAIHHEKLLSENDLLEFLPEMIRLQDEPIADPVCMPVYYVSKLARDNNIKVCQVGEGADELFWGYDSWRQWQKLQHWTSKPWTQPLSKFGAHSMELFGKSNNRLFDSLSRSAVNKPAFWSSAQGPTRYELNSLLGQNIKKDIYGLDGWDRIEPLWKRFTDKSWEQSALSWMSFVELSLRIPELLLMRVDKMSMGASLEARVPFLDHKFVELAMSIPQSRKMHNNESKHVLKQALRGHIPNNIIDRKKTGFGVPVNEWLDNKLGKHIERELISFCRDTGIFSEDGVRSIMRSKSRVRVWYLYNFALWHRHFIEGVHQDSLL